MALTPQIDGNIISLEQTEKVLPSKTYKINNDVVSTEIEIEEGKPTVVESDEMITIDDLSYEQISLNIKGNSWQETRSGKNLWRTNVTYPFTQMGVTVDYDEETNIYTLNGTAIGSMFIRTFEGAFKEFKTGDVLTTSIYKVGGQVTSSNDYALYVGGYNDSDGKTSWVGNCSLRVTAESNSLTETLTRDGMTHAMLWVATAGVVYDNFQFKIQLEEGNTATEYEPYGAMPSPEFRSEIRNVTGSANITVCNKNLAILDDGSLGDYRLINAIPVKAGEIITVIVNYTQENDSYFIPRVYRDKNLTERLEEYPQIKTTNQDVVNTYTISNDGYFGFVSAYQYYTYNFSKIFIAKGEYSLEDYEEHQSQQITFPLSEGQRMYKDSYLADTGIYHQRFTDVWNGTEEWILNTSESDKFYFWHIVRSSGFPDAKAFGIELCDKFKVRNWQDGPLITEEGVYNATAVFVLALKKERCEHTVTALKKWLAENPITIEYELYNPKTEPYTEEQQAIYNEINDILIESSIINIFSNDEIKPFVKVIYFSADNIIFNTGEKDRIIGYADGLEAIKQAIYHILNTERYAYLIYDDNYGVEFEQYIGKDFNFIQATIEDTLREALTHDLRITDVMVNSIDKIDSNVVAINFTATTVYGDLVLGVNINV